MWFLSFAIVATTCLSLLVYGWASYLERAAASSAHAREVAALVPPPLPPQRPAPQAQATRIDVPEIVREPKPDAWNARGWRGRNGAWHKSGWNKSGWNKSGWNKGAKSKPAWKKPTWKASGKSRQTPGHETR